MAPLRWYRILVPVVETHWVRFERTVMVVVPAVWRMPVVALLLAATSPPLPFCRCAAGDSLHDTGVIGAILSQLERGSPTTSRPSGLCRSARARYLMRLKMLKMGRYSAMIIDPTSPPTITIIRGSMMDVSDSVVDSTSWS